MAFVWLVPLPLPALHGTEHLVTECIHPLSTSHLAHRSNCCSAVRIFDSPVELGLTTLPDPRKPLHDPCDTVGQHDPRNPSRAPRCSLPAQFPSFPLPWRFPTSRQP
ncbi:uncharacterized protein F5891DRAFT_1001004 [Suillus fuscotomentosus]|uniref:Secreted protein n=1 Tax=Suillus fuscotomentosus TaxID=1912939 RepID=A0AAD4EJD8_9AGAM|nr:uncharacterized protein F5891DRAFT_1001004 [Suillus fuscotomentosus]KAG1907298.1 hypothetical protein F5891DRAFT_1001004 [Suillus fuscotomentosus]